MSVSQGGVVKVSMIIWYLFLIKVICMFNITSFEKGRDGENLHAHITVQAAVFMVARV